VIAATALPFLGDRSCFLAAVGAERTANALLRLGKFSLLAAHIALVARVVGLDELSGHGKSLRQCCSTLKDQTRQTAEGSVTLDHIRGHGCRRLLVYCVSTWCNHRANLDADWLPDETVIRALCPRMVCTACGLIGAEVRPDWSPATGRRPPEWREGTA
jgi:hypothetical protein